MRITENDLREAVASLNRAAGTPSEPYNLQKNGKFKRNPGSYALDYGYGYVKLYQMDDAFAYRTIFDFTTKSELFQQIKAYSSGIHNTKKQEATQ